MFIPLELAIRPSRVYAGVLLIACSLAVTGIWLAAIPAWGQVLMTLGLIPAILLYWRKGLSSIQGLRITQSGQIEILQLDWQSATIKGQPVVLPWLVSLKVAPGGGKARRLMIWPDAVDKDSARKLRVWMNWGFQPAAKK